ncbi:hypothetical protein AVEN_176577-1, partial [Araneus ventricosus]
MAEAVRNFVNEAHSAQIHPTSSPVPQK